MLLCIIENMEDKIVNWIKEYAERHDKTALIVGVSGGIDSAVVSTLCAKTGITTIPCILSINSPDWLAFDHVRWLDDEYTNIDWRVDNVENLFRAFESTAETLEADSELGFANSRSRLRMALLYQIAQSNNGLVVGTGNKVEDFGVGFFTKYGDGGVDISPIGDLYKSEVYELGASLGILDSIMEATPTDGLWDDGRTDEDQMGLTYDELEEAMLWNAGSPHYEKYMKLRTANLHKMEPIPVCLKKKPNAVRDAYLYSRREDEPVNRKAVTSEEMKKFYNNGPHIGVRENDDGTWDMSAAARMATDDVKHTKEYYDTERNKAPKKCVYDKGLSDRSQFLRTMKQKHGQAVMTTSEMMQEELEPLPINTFK